MWIDEVVPTSSSRAFAHMGAARAPPERRFLAAAQGAAALPPERRSRRHQRRRRGASLSSEFTAWRCPAPSRFHCGAATTSAAPCKQGGGEGRRWLSRALGARHHGAAAKSRPHNISSDPSHGSLAGGEASSSLLSSSTTEVPGSSVSSVSNSIVSMVKRDNTLYHSMISSSFSARNSSL